MTRSGRGDGVGVRRALLGYKTRHKVSDAVAVRQKRPIGVIASVSMHAISESREKREQFHSEDARTGA